MKTTSRIYCWSLTVALGGFLFGFDTAVISGVEKSIQQLFDLSPFAHGFAISSALIGTIAGALFAGKPADKYGRRPLLFGVAVAYLISAIGTALSVNVSMFILFRFLGGIAVGASSVVAPMYISEIAPASIRGKMTASFQLNVIIGILMAFVSNFLLRDTGENAWRYMLAVLALPSVLFFAGLFFVPESPRFLIKVGMKEKAMSILKKIRTGGIEQEVAEIAETVDTTGGKLFSRLYSKSVMIAFLVAMFNQFSGINAILYFAPRIFELSGLPESTAFFHPVIIGITNALFTLLGLALVDKVGRRTLLIIGSIGMAICLLPVSVIFFTHSHSGLLLWFLVGYILFFAVSTGTVIWILISEVFPTNVRGYGQSFGSFTHWFFAAVITFLFPVISTAYANGAAYIFAFFGIMMIVQLFTAWKYFPETKGKTIEEISNQLQSKNSVVSRKRLLMLGLGLCLFLTIPLISCDNAIKIPDYQSGDDNAKTHSGPAAVFIGNSLTEAWNYFLPDFFVKNNYVAKGIGGQTTSQMLARFKTDVIDLDPQCIIIMGGINDLAHNPGFVSTPDSIVENLFKMVAMAKAYKIEPLICSLTPAKQFDWNMEIQNVPQQILELNVLVKKQAEQNNIPYVDYHSLLKDSDNGLQQKYKRDGTDNVHVNADAYGIMGTLIFEKINQIILKNN